MAKEEARIHAVLGACAGAERPDRSGYAPHRQLTELSTRPDTRLSSFADHPQRLDPVSDFKFFVNRVQMRVDRGDAQSELLSNFLSMTTSDR